MTATPEPDSVGQLATDIAAALGITFEAAHDRIRAVLADPTPTPTVERSQSPAWKLTWGDHTFTEQDLTGQHAALLALIHKDESWTPLGVSPLDGPVALMAYLAAFIAIAEGRDCLEVQIELAEQPLTDLMGAVGQ